MYDFLRFLPSNLDRDILAALGFDGFIVMQNQNHSITLESENLRAYTGVLIASSDVKGFRQKLRNVRRDVIVGVYSDKSSVYREAVMRKKVDIILDGPERELEYAVIKLAAEKDVAIEFCLSKFLHAYGFRRMKLFEKLKDEITVVKKFDTPFIISSAATSLPEMRTKRQIETFFSFFGLDVKKSVKHAERIIRRYHDPNYIMNGFEVENQTL
jgi:ribonuclease P/MRP protein subunit RPP1